MPPSRPIPTLARRALSALAVVALASGVAACGGDEDIARADFQEKLIERTAIPEAMAACITDRVYDEFDQETINEIVVAATVEELRDSYEPLAAINEECAEEPSE